MNSNPQEQNDALLIERRGGDRRTAEYGQYLIHVPARHDLEGDINEICYGTFPGIELIVQALVQRDEFTRAHVIHTNRLANRFVRFLELSARDSLIMLQAALLHDVGKMGVDDCLLMKTTSLTAEEYEQVKLHTMIGRNMIAPYKGYERVATIIGQHHERFDGSGYPNRLAGEAIDPIARAIAVIDAFSAMILPRPYHGGIPEREAIAEIVRYSGSQFDPQFVQLFTRMVGDQAVAI